MFSDLKVTIVEGGPDPELWKGMYPTYLYFSSREGKFRSGKWKIKEDGCRGRVVFKKEVIFYFEYEEGEELCKKYPIKDGSSSKTYIQIGCRVELID